MVLICDLLNMLQMPGDCICKPGYSGSNCDKCALGFFGYPICQPCPCNVAGTIDPNNCEGRCECKVSEFLCYCFSF